MSNGERIFSNKSNKECWAPFWPLKRECLTTFVLAPGRSVDSDVTVILMAHFLFILTGVLCCPRAISHVEAILSSCAQPGSVAGKKCLCLWTYCLTKRTLVIHCFV